MVTMGRLSFTGGAGSAAKSISTRQRLYVIGSGPLVKIDVTLAPDFLRGRLHYLMEAAMKKKIVSRRIRAAGLPDRRIGPAVSRLVSL